MNTGGDSAEEMADEPLTLEEFEAMEAGIVEVDRGLTEEALIVKLSAYEGPLDVLLTLARAQKVDLKQISILALAEQYLEFIAEARKVRLELAADYLVMAAWLAFLKSRLLLPVEDDSGEGPSAEELAARLAFRLQRLEAMRKSASRLFGRDRLGRDFFFRGAPEGIRVVRTTSYESSLFELLKAYGDQQSRVGLTDYTPPKPPVFSMDMALKRLAMLVGDVPEWTVLSSFLPADWKGSVREVRSALAGTFAASLEMVREGQLELHQEDTYGPIYLRSRSKKEPVNEDKTDD